MKNDIDYIKIEFLEKFADLLDEYNVSFHSPAMYRPTEPDLDVVSSCMMSDGDWKFSGIDVYFNAAHIDRNNLKDLILYTKQEK